MRRAVAALDAARNIADTAPCGLLAAIDAVADVPAEETITQLLPWLTDIFWLRGRIDAALDLLRADPFARPPLRPAGGNDGPGSLVLAERGAVRLSLQLWPFATLAPAPAPARAVFIPGHAALHILASGKAALHQHSVAVGAAEEAGGFTAKGAAPCHSLPPRPLQQGETLRLDTARQAITLAGGRADVLLLELTVQPPSPLPIRTYDIANGGLLHVSASRRDSSFRQMALALLRHLGRTDAAPLFAAEIQSEDFAARWNAMRELVALDSAAAHPLLEAMSASDPHPEVRRAAAATRSLIFPPSGETGREGGGGPGPCTSPVPSTPTSARRDRNPAPCPA
ncbi:HEAT repeat domain-containing protein [Sphingopyxis sp.]|uniref:HEAT repeat domain-containing protein n=1 Tax=Sphingopyxis sp. TaxID=1908224 RepID=UPI002ED82B71